MAIYLGERPSDSSVRGIIAVNVAVVAWAVLSGEGLLLLLWPYWIQSVVIGYYNVRRMQKLQVFKTDGVKINGSEVDPTPSTRRQSWMFFTVHYGFFHFGYLIFLLAFSASGMMDGTVPITNTDTGETTLMEVGRLRPLDTLWFVAAFVGFMVSHGASHREHVEADLRNIPNIGTLMFLPYLRVIPMHITIILGAVLGGGAAGVLLFGGLKTVADVAMHKVEHRMLQGPR